MSRPSEFPELLYEQEMGHPTAYSCIVPFKDRSYTRKRHDSIQFCNKTLNNLLRCSFASIDVTQQCYYFII